MKETGHKVKQYKNNAEKNGKAQNKKRKY